MLLDIGVLDLSSIAKIQSLVSHARNKEGRHGATPRYCCDKENEDGWPHAPTAEKRAALSAMYWVPEGGRRKKGRPNKTWRSTFKEELEEMGVSWHGARTIASDRD